MFHACRGMRCPSRKDSQRSLETALVPPGIVVDLQRVGSGTPILLLHGVEGVQEDHDLISRLSENHEVVAPTHPGFGLSPLPKWFETVEDIAYTYLSLLDVLDLRNVHVVGLQFGAWVAAEMAIRDCSRMSGMTLVSPVGIKTGGPMDREIVDVFATSRQNLDSARFADPQNNPLRDLKAASRETVLFAARNEEALATYTWEPYMHNPRLKHWLNRITVPVTVIRGDQDRITDADYSRGFADLLPRAALEVIPGAAHCAQIDQPGQVADIITNAQTKEGF